jgi:hypothetical protein
MSLFPKFRMLLRPSMERSGVTASQRQARELDHQLSEGRIPSVTVVQHDLQRSLASLAACFEISYAAHPWVLRSAERLSPYD